MQPGLASDVLLLAVQDPARWCTRGRVDTVLGGALLCEAVWAGAVLPPVRGGRHRTRDLGDVVLTRALTALRDVTDPLVREHAVAPLEHRVLGLFPRRGLVVVDGGARVDALQRLAAALQPGSRPPPGPAALAVLCAVSGIARHHLGPPFGRTDAVRLAEHLNGLRKVVGPGVSDVLVGTRAAYRRSRAGDDDFVAAGGGGDGFGDSGGDGGGGGGGDGGGGGGGD